MATTPPNFCTDEHAYIDSDDETDSSLRPSMYSSSSSGGMSSMTGATSTDGEVLQAVPSHVDDSRRRFPSLATSVKINVEGAFIVEDDCASQTSVDNDHIHWERKDIRLPHHTDVVSHVAVDVGETSSTSTLPLTI